MDIWEPGEVEHLTAMLLSADEKNMFLALELLKNREGIDIEPLAEALLLIKMDEHDADIVEKVSFFLDNISDLEKKEEIETIYNLFISYWSESNKQAFLQALNTYEKSRWIYEEYMLLMPFYVHIYDDLIDSLKQLNEKQIQFKYMKRALEIQPDNALRHFNYAYAMSDIPGYVDEVIKPEQTREKLIKAFKMLENKVAVLPKKKHGNIPL